MNLRRLVVIGLLFLLGASALPGCSRARVEPSERLKEGYGKAVDPYEKKGGKIMGSQLGKPRDPYARPPGK